MAVRRAASSSMRNDRVMKDTEALLHYFDRDAAVKSGAKGCIGYCMGGRFAVLAACHFPEIFLAAASLFGTRLISDAPDSPHLLLQKIKGELYCGFAEHDPSVPLSTVEEFTDLLKKANVKSEVEVHPGTHHGYAFPGRVVYHEAAAERSWERIFAMFKRQIPA